MEPATMPSFPTHARTVVHAVRGAFVEVLAAVGADAQDPQSIGQSLGLNRNLAWKISKIIQTDDPSVALNQMPGPGGIRIFLRSGERAGASLALIQTARDAIRDYEELIRVHSGDRATLQMMGSGLSEAGRRRRDEQHRKHLFQGGSYVWGAQARVSRKIGVVVPGASPEFLDFASINALVDFRRIRSDVAWTMASRQSKHDDGSPMTPSGYEPLDPGGAGPDGAPLMTAFCSRPAPELRRVDDERTTTFELVEGPVGNTGALTCVVGTVQRGIPCFRTPENDWAEYSAICDIPAEFLVLDLLIHERLSFASGPETDLFSELHPAHPNAAMTRNRLPLNEPLQELGQGPLAPATPDLPGYTRLMETVFARLGHEPAAFRGYRIKIAYPAHPAALRIRYRLPENPAGSAR